MIASHDRSCNELQSSLREGLSRKSNADSTSERVSVGKMEVESCDT